MNVYRSKKIIFVFLFLLFFSISFTSFAIQPAQAKPVTDGKITLSPPFEQISLQSVDQDKTFPLTITNNTSESKEFALSVVDFGSLADSGGIAFLGKTSNTLKSKYSLIDWMELEKNSVLLDPGKSESVNVTIHANSSLSAGGHYGAVIAKIQTTQSLSSQKGKLAIIEELASLVFVNKTDGDIFNLILKDVTFPNSLIQIPQSVNLTFFNNGNIHVVPRGNILLVNPNGVLIKEGIINSDSDLILPETFREVENTLTTTNADTPPGMYTITINYRFDGKSNVDQLKYSFFYIGLPALLGSILIIFLLLLGITLIILIRRHKKYLPTVHKPS